jgi:hypothetical protein
MNEPKGRAQDLLAQLTSATASPEPADRADARRERVVARLSDLHGDLLRERAQSRLLRRRLVWLAAAAAAVLAVGGGLGAYRSTGVNGVAMQAAATGAGLEIAKGAVRVTQGGRTSDVTAPGRLVLGSPAEVATDEGKTARIVTEGGIRIDLLASTRFRLGAAGGADRSIETTNLQRGQVDVQVPKLAPGRRFAIRTPDAIAEVRGTQFSVSVTDSAPNGSSVTRVSVREGRVVVRYGGAEYVLDAGAAWASDSSGRAAASESQPVEQEQPARDIGTATAGKTPTATASSLGEETRLLEQAMLARREGNDRRAVGLLDRLLAKSPRSPLAQEASAERFRALRHVGDANAAERAAARYLADYPNGFAADEARAMLANPASASGK